jgi:hypothetical protein
MRLLLFSFLSSTEAPALVVVKPSGLACNAVGAHAIPPFDIRPVSLPDYCLFDEKRHSLQYS